VRRADCDRYDDGGHPITTPSIVNSDRARLRTSALNAVFSVDFKFMPEHRDGGGDFAVPLVANHGPIAKRNQPIRVGSDARVVRHEQNRNALFDVQAPKERP